MSDDDRLTEAERRALTLAHAHWAKREVRLAAKKRAATPNAAPPVRPPTGDE